MVIGGASAGGGLAAALVLKLHDSGPPMPGVCILATLDADLTESGGSFRTNLYCQPRSNGRTQTNSIALYANGHDLRDAYLSPLFAAFTKGFSPAILTCGTLDLFLSNTVFMHRALLRAEVAAELHVWEAMPGGGFGGIPEDQEVLAQQAAFIRTKLGQLMQPPSLG